jgi:3-oxoacyl-[acyl-carrier-protein] synthase II
MKRRVVITGVGVVSPVGNDLDAVTQALAEGRSGVRTMDEWSRIGGVETRVGAPVQPYTLPSYSRKQLRTMGPVAKLATYATEAAIADAGLSDELVRSG